MKNFLDLKKEIESEKFNRLYLLTGEEKGVMNRYIHRIHETPEKVTVNGLKRSLKNKGLFSKGNRCFIVENDNELLKEDFNDILNLIKEDIVILVYDQMDKRKKFFKDAKNHIYEFNRLSTDDLLFFADKFLDCSDELKRLAIERCKNDVFKIENELHKLSHFPEELTEQIIIDHIHVEAEDRIFDLLNELIKGDIERSFKYFSDLRKLNESDVKITVLLYDKIRQLFLLKSYSDLSDKEIMNKTGLNYYQVKYGRELVPYRKTTELMDMMLKCYELETKIKTGQAEQGNQLDQLILDMIM